MYNLQTRSRRISSNFINKDVETTARSFVNPHNVTLYEAYRVDTDAD
jgi:hypothetical protein